MKKLINFIQFQAVWFLCILGAAHGFEWPAILVSVLILAWAWWVSEDRRHDQWLMIIAIALGIVIDSSLVWLGVMSFKSEIWTGFSPIWMPFIWAALAITIQSSMSWLARSYRLAAVLGAISGPFAYWAGVRMEAGTFHDFITAIATLSVIWLVVTPFLFYCSQRLKESHVQR
jgi:hypothetical protein